MGIYFNKENDFLIYEAAINEAKSIVQSARKISVSDLIINSKDTTYNGYFNDDDEDESGYCIRCKDEIDLDGDKPYCYTCYKIWAKYEDDEYEEKYCHSCGKKRKTRLSEPFCTKCEYLILIW